MKKWLVALFVLSMVACTTVDDTSNPKPEVDPDAEVTGKADRLSNRYTNIVGELEIDGIVRGDIDYPDYFHGYTIELEAGQEIQFTTWADEFGIVRLYGPSRYTTEDGRPRFQRALVRELTERNGDRENNEFVYEPIESGTYMILYGPYYAWNSKFEISTKCLGGCQAEELTAAELEANIIDYARTGKKVSVTGYVGSGLAACTKRACDLATPCCNTCGSSERLFATAPHLGEAVVGREGGIALEKDGELLSCSGNECNLAETCTVDAGQYIITGVVKKGEFEYYLDIETLEPVVASQCQTNDDCGADAWCRRTDWGADAPMECVPFVGEGESCSGFAPPQFVNSCSPDLQCVFRPFIADAPGTCRHNLTVADLEADPAKWDGVRVNVDGYINTQAPICTQMACGPSNPCCNRCGAGQVLSDNQQRFGQGLSLEQNGETFGCGGNECTVTENCTVDQGGKYRVIGVFRQGQFGHTIEVEEYLSLERI